MASNKQRINIGVCVYGIPYMTGVAGYNTPRRYEKPLGNLQVLELADRLGLSVVELPKFTMPPGDDPKDVAAIRRRAEELGLRLVVAGRRATSEQLLDDLQFAAALGAKVVRCQLSGVLQGDRREIGLDGFRALLQEAAVFLKTQVAPMAADLGLKVGVENHQDATSDDLLWLVHEVGSPNVGVTFDAGNPIAVGEEVIPFAKKVLPHIVNVHLKDYRIFPNPSGFQLAHCPSGTGVVPFAELFELLKDRPEVNRSIEMAALGERLIRLFEDDYWAQYPKRELSDVLPVIRFLRQHEETGDWRTPWDRGLQGEEMAAWEMKCLETSVARFGALA